MATVQRFEELEIWKLAFEQYKKVSSLCEKLRGLREFKFADQMKSAAGSVMDNIAEGFGRNSRLEFVNSLGISKGECAELQSQFYRCLFDTYIDKYEFENLYSDADAIAKGIANFTKYLNSTPIRGHKFKNRTV